MNQQDLGHYQRTEVVRFNVRRQTRSHEGSLDEVLTALLQVSLEQLHTEKIEAVLARTAKLPGESKRRFRRAFDQHVLSRPIHRLVLVIEEGDHLHGSAAETDFFALLRSMAEDTSAIYQKLRLIVTIGAEAGFLETTNHSAFFGLSPPIVLEGFSLDELGAAAALYGLGSDDPGVKALHRHTGGHPYYCRLAIHEAVCGERSLRQLLASMDARGGPFAAALQRLRSYVEREGLKPVLCAILASPRCNLPAEQYLKLYRQGLVVEVSPGEYRMRCPLLTEYFQALCR